MSDVDDAREGEKLAREWLEGRSELVDDLAELCGGMPKPLGAIERAFLHAVGNAARALARREMKPAAEAAAPARIEAQAPAAPPARASIDVDESWRRARQRARRARFEELAQANAQISPIIDMRPGPGHEWS